jgi:hypothetical protein
VAGLVACESKRYDERDSVVGVGDRAAEVEVAAGV